MIWTPSAKDLTGLKTMYSPATLKNKILIKAVSFMPKKHMDDRDISSLTDELWIKTKLSTVTALFVETEELSAVADEKVFNTRDLFYRTFNDQVFKHGKKQMLRWTNKNVWQVYHKDSKDFGKTINPQKAWNHGVQMVCQNQSSFNKDILYGYGKFS